MKCWFLTDRGNSAKYYSIFLNPCLKYEDKQGMGVVFVPSLEYFSPQSSLGEVSLIKYSWYIFPPHRLNREKNKDWKAAVIC